MTIELPIEREQTDGSFKEIITECTFDYSKGMRGQRDSCGGVARAGAPLEPDSEAECEFLGAVDMETGKEIELTDSEQESATERAWESLPDDDRDCDE